MSLSSDPAFARPAAAGDSGSRKASVKQEDARFAEFLAHSGRKPFEQMVTAHELASYDLVEGYATWLADVYKIKTGQRAGKGYMAQTVVNKINDRMLALKKRLLLLGLHAGGGEEGELVRRFLSAMDAQSRSDAYKWIVGVRHTTARRIFERMKAGGERTDMSATPVYPLHVQEICKAYEAAGSAEAWTRRLAVAATGLTAGRASEAAWLNTDRCGRAAGPLLISLCLLLTPHLPVSPMSPIAALAGTTTSCACTRSACNRRRQSQKRLHSWRDKIETAAFSTSTAACWPCATSATAQTSVLAGCYRHCSRWRNRARRSAHT